MAEITVSFTVNGRGVEVQTDPTRTLLSILRDDLNLKGAKEACGQGDCGACVVLFNGEAINSCLVLAAQAEDSVVLTVEGLAENSELHPLQQHYTDNWAFQCGYCTAGMLMSSYALLLKNPNPTPEEVRAAIAGNLCRCTGYNEIVEAVLSAAEALQVEG